MIQSEITNWNRKGIFPVFICHPSQIDSFIILRPPIQMTIPLERFARDVMPLKKTMTRNNKIVALGAMIYLWSGRVRQMVIIIPALVTLLLYNISVHNN